jgi:hypothetical protein
MKGKVGKTSFRFFPFYAFNKNEVNNILEIGFIENTNFVKGNILNLLIS